MASAPGRGLLLVLEGAEGVGKTTQARRLAAALGARGVPCEPFREPGGTPLGDEIRRLLLSPGHHDVVPRAEALLFMAARAQLMAHVAARVAAGAVVLLDRFFLSTYAYQVAGRGLPEGEVLTANRLATGGLRPDLTLLLACDPAIARARTEARGELDRMEREDAAFHARVDAAFRAALDPAWQRDHPELGPIVRVEAGDAEPAVTASLLAALAARWPDRFGAETFASQGESHSMAGG